MPGRFIVFTPFYGKKQGFLTLKEAFLAGAFQKIDWIL